MSEAWDKIATELGDCPTDDFCYDSSAQQSDIGLEIWLPGNNWNLLPMQNNQIQGRIESVIDMDRDVRG